MDNLWIWLIYPLAIKRGQLGNPLEMGRFNRNIIYKWCICHCHAWLPEGIFYPLQGGSADVHVPIDVYLAMNFVVPSSLGTSSLIFRPTSWPADKLLLSHLGLCAKGGLYSEMAHLVGEKCCSKPLSLGVPWCGTNSFKFWESPKVICESLFSPHPLHFFGLHIHHSRGIILVVDPPFPLDTHDIPIYW